MKRLFILFISVIMVQLSYGQAFKVVGYLPDYEFSILNSINYSKTTHVLAAFGNPDSSGVMSFSQNIDAFATAVHNDGAKAMLSIAGGGDYSWGNSYHIYEYLFTDANRAIFIGKVMDYVRAHQLDGIDLDLEGYALELTNYNIFAQQLADSLHALNLTISGTYVSGSMAAYVSDATLQKLDFITAQSYGGIGSWNYNSPSDQAPYSLFKSDIDFWKSRGLTAAKVVGGLPFYVSQFPITEYPYSPPPDYNIYMPKLCSVYEDPQFIGQDPLKYDLVYTTDGDPVYLNSLPTFRKKINYAVANAGGIMIWELGGDCYDGTLNILDTLNTYIAAQITLSVEGKSPASSLKFYPNPANSFIKIDGQSQASMSYTISDVYGREIINSTLLDPLIDVSKIAPGMYLLNVMEEGVRHDPARLVIQR
ncbi:MAG TPA: glycosyl hydrolase family 18 protein [Cytophagaceae bacterium]|jgi:chitinase|nr:glycosyl hydrolase family 18 protein [Cytophagaceae bacterium]